MISDGEAINRTVNRTLKQILGRDTIVFDIKYENVPYPTFVSSAIVIVTSNLSMTEALADVTEPA
jgi:hypothetical protein